VDSTGFLTSLGIAGGLGDGAAKFACEGVVFVVLTY